MAAPPITVASYCWLRGRRSPRSRTTGSWRAAPCHATDSSRYRQRGLRRPRSHAVRGHRDGRRRHQQRLARAARMPRLRRDSGNRRQARARYPGRADDGHDDSSSCGDLGRRKQRSDAEHDGWLPKQGLFRLDGAREEPDRRRGDLPRCRRPSLVREQPRANLRRPRETRRRRPRLLSASRIRRDHVHRDAGRIHPPLRHVDGDSHRRRDRRAAAREVASGAREHGKLPSDRGLGSAFRCLRR